MKIFWDQRETLFLNILCLTAQLSMLLSNLIHKANIIIFFSVSGVNFLSTCDDREVCDTVTRRNYFRPREALFFIPLAMNYSHSHCPTYH